MDVPDLVLHLLAQAAVQGAERLVHQHQAGLEHQRAADGDALLLASGELVGPPVLESLQPHQPQRPLHARAALRGIEAAHLQREGQILSDRQVREQRVVLEDHADVALPRRQVVHGPPGDADGAGRRGLEPCQHHQAGGLARARRPEQGQELPFANAQVQIADDQRAPVVALVDRYEFDVRPRVRGRGRRRGGLIRSRGYASGCGRRHGLRILPCGGHHASADSRPSPARASSIAPLTTPSTCTDSV